MNISSGSLQVIFFSPNLTGKTHPRQSLGQGRATAHRRQWKVVWPSTMGVVGTLRKGDILKSQKLAEVWRGQCCRADTEGRALAGFEKYQVVGGGSGEQGGQVNRGGWGRELLVLFEPRVWSNRPHPMQTGFSLNHLPRTCDDLLMVQPGL